MNRVLLMVVFTICFLSSTLVELSGQSTSFVSLDEIPPAASGTIDGYYDIQTGDVLVQVGPDVLLFGIPFEPVSLLEDTFAENVGVFDTTKLNIETAIGSPQQNNSGGVAWLNFAAFPVGLHNLGPMLEAYPLGEPVTGDETTFDEQVSSLYGNYSPEISYIYQVAGSIPVRRTFGVIQPRFEATSVPEPSGSTLITVLSAAVVLRRRR